MKVALNLTSKANIAVDNALYYSAASYCFGANVKLTYLLLALNNVTDKEVLENIETMDENVEKLDEGIDRREKKTITDLEAYAIVKERLIESKDYRARLVRGNISNLTRDSFFHKGNLTDGDLYDFAYAYERVFSAFSWANFFDHRGNEVKINKELLESSCQSKIGEAEERYNYVLLFYPTLDLSGTKQEIDYAYKDLEGGNYALCLFKATKAKSESDVILSLLGVGNDKLSELLDKKLKIARKNIAKQVNKGNFPILAYSYYEYGNELRGSDKYSALLYSEYAIELSNLDMYFRNGKKSRSLNVDIKPIIFLIGGLFLGILVGFRFKMGKPRKLKGRRKTSRKKT